MDLPAALLDVHHDENSPQGISQTLSRSPHPYQRDGHSVLQESRSVSADLRAPSSSPTIVPQFTPTENGSTYFDADHRRRRKRSSSPSESGTEADDERGSLLPLPAPPTRPRKGLIGADHSNTASPLLTPSYLDEEPQRLASKRQRTSRMSLRSRSCTDEETSRIREKFTRRRRAELIRRASETFLIGAVCLVACTGNTAQFLHSHPGKLFHNVLEVDAPGMSHVPPVLLGYTAVVLGLYVFYPLHLAVRNWGRSVSQSGFPFYVHIPAAFEPAPLLYPILIPVFVAVSLMQADATFLLPNVVLGIASIPSKIIPFNTDIAWYNSLHWILSIVPVLVSERRYLKDHQIWSQQGSENALIPDPNSLLFLYPLHQALLPVLQYLTTTSLLPAELQLLSVSMIDLLLLSRSPQMVILQSLLWLGGLSMFVFCKKVLICGVALARIPSWRLRRSSIRALEGSTFLRAIDDTLGGRLSKWVMTPADSEDSDESAGTDFKRPPQSPSVKKSGRIQERGTQRSAGSSLIQIAVNTPRSATDDVNQDGFLGANDVKQGLQSGAIYERRRRYTVPSYLGSSPARSPTDSRRRKESTQMQSSKRWSPRSLSKAQATVIKWLFAIYVYGTVVAIIAFGIRHHVGRDALHSQEPVGWALGYLLGDLPPFRYLMSIWNLDHWILLPGPMLSRETPGAYSWNQTVNGLGLANLRLLICGYCIAIICVGLAVLNCLSAVAEVDTRRKVFHGMMVAMFLPTIFVDPTFVSLAFSLILAIFLLLDLFRASQLPPLSKPLTYFLAPYVDGRDHRGPVIVSHIFLLIGCAIPLWLSLAAIERTNEGPWEGWGVERREVSMISGVVCVGMGDAAASLIGRRYGRRRWCWSGGKSLEGSFAFAIAVVIGLSLARLLLQMGGWVGDSEDSWASTLGKASIAASGASLTEALLTGGNDNVIVPVILWLLVRGLRI